MKELKRQIREVADNNNIKMICSQFEISDVACHSINRLLSRFLGTRPTASCQYIYYVFIWNFYDLMRFQGKLGNIIACAYFASILLKTALFNTS